MKQLQNGSLVETKKHSKYSASGSHRWINCPGSIKLSEKAPPQLENEYAKEGTLAHQILEDILNSKHPHKYVSALRSNQDYDQTMVEHCYEAFKYIESITPEGAIRLAETALKLPDYIGPNLFGTVDCLIATIFDELIVIDFKYGAGVPVEVKHNTQLIYYALAAAINYDYNFETVRMIIIQPRAFHEDGPIRETKMGVNLLQQYETLFKNAIQICEKPNPPLKAGEWCRWCPAKLLCPEISSKAMQEAQIVFDEVEEEITHLPVESIPAQNLGRTLKTAELLEVWIEALKDHAFNQAKAGVKIEGYKLVEKRSTRKWFDAAKVEKAAYKKYKDLIFTKPELLSPAQFEKATGDKDFVFKNTTAISSGITLVPESDKRQEIKNVVDVFSAVEDKPLLVEKTKTSRKTKGKQDG